MKLKYVLVAAIAAGTITLGSMSGVLAAGLGVVDIGYLEQHHPKFNQAITTYQNDVQQSRTAFTNQSKNMTNTQKQQLIANYNNQLNQQRVALFTPIDQDIMNAINRVRAAKGLDYVAAKGAVLSSTTQVADITAEVAQQIGK